MNNLVSLPNIETHSFKCTPHGLHIIGDPTFEQWVDFGQGIHQYSESLHFIIGDWLNYGQRTYKDTYKKAVEAFGFDIQTLRNDKWVASRVLPELRNPSLSFSHYKAIANIEQDDQEELIAQAVEKKLSSKAFEKYVQEQQLHATASKRTASESSPRGDSVAVSGTTLLKVQAATVFSDQLLSKLDEIDFDELSPKVRDELLRTLGKVHKRIDGLFMTYQEEDDE